MASKDASGDDVPTHGVTAAAFSYGTLLDALRGLRWPARRAVAAAPPGAHRSSQRGTAGEFTEYRLYRQGDDPRALDWRLLGRSDRAFIRLSDDRALLTTWLVVDASASMAYPASAHADAEGPRSKWQMACAVATGLAAVVQASSDPVGVLVTGAHGASRLPPRTRRGTVQEIARVLDAVSCGGADALAPHVAALSPRARIVCLTDCLGDQEALHRTAAALTAAGGQFECVHIVAAEELELPRGAFLVRDPETGSLVAGPREARFQPHSRSGSEAQGIVLSARARDEYRRTFTAFREEMRQEWRAIGAGYTQLITTDDPARAVRAVVMGIGSC